MEEVRAFLAWRKPILVQRHQNESWSVLCRGVIRVSWLDVRVWKEMRSLRLLEKLFGGSLQSSKDQTEELILDPKGDGKCDE